MDIEYADFAELLAQGANLIGATATWGGVIKDPRRGVVGTALADCDSIVTGMAQSCFEIIRAIASNPASGAFGSLCTIVDLTEANLDAVPPTNRLWYIGQPGTPKIQPFDGGPWITGEEATAAEIDAYRNDVAGKIYGGTYGQQFAHDQGIAADSENAAQRSPVSCRFNVDRGVFTFSGFAAKWPLIQITMATAKTSIPIDLSPAVVKSFFSKMVKPGDNLYQLAPLYQRLAEMDKQEIRGGAVSVRDVPMPHEIYGQQKPL